MSLSTVRRDARVLRQINYLGEHFDVGVIAYADPRDDGSGLGVQSWMPILKTSESNATPTRQVFRRVKKALGAHVTPRLPAAMKAEAYLRWYWQRPESQALLSRALSRRFDVYHANCWDTLPVAVRAARQFGARVFFDAHEYAPLEYENDPEWLRIQSPAITSVIRSCSPHVDAASTVVPAIADRLRAEFDLDPVVVMNAPEPVHFVPSRPVGSVLRLIHHGGCARARRLERMIEAVAACTPRYTLDLMLLDDDPDYMQELQALAASVAPDHVHFREPVAPSEIVQTVAQYDMGFCLIEPSSYNYWISLPNKLFDFLAAGLPVIIGPSPSMVQVIETYGAGRASASFEVDAVAATLRAISREDIEEMRLGACRARGAITARSEMGKMVAQYQQILGVRR
jgi:hypothetical protein